jgi:hypothetical protein
LMTKTLLLQVAQQVQQQQTALDLQLMVLV